MMKYWHRFKENLLKDYKRILIIVSVTVFTVCFILQYQSSFTTVIILAVYVIFYLLIQLLNSNVISQNDKIAVNVKMFAIVVAIILSVIFYKQNFNVISSLIGISLLLDVVNQSFKIYYFHKNMVAVNELVIYTKNEEISEEEVVEIISMIRPHYNYLHKKIDVKAIDGEMANRVREIVVSRRK